MQDLKPEDTENYKQLLKKIKEELNKWKKSYVNEVEDLLLIRR